MRRTLILIRSNSEQKENQSTCSLGRKTMRAQNRAREFRIHPVAFSWRKLWAIKSTDFYYIETCCPIKRSLLLTYTLVQRDFQPALRRTKIQLICTLHKAKKPAWYGHRSVCWMTHQIVGRRQATSTSAFSLIYSSMRDALIFAKNWTDAWLMEGQGTWERRRCAYPSPSRWHECALGRLSPLQWWQNHSSEIWSNETFPQG